MTPAVTVSGPATSLRVGPRRGSGDVIDEAVAEMATIDPYSNVRAVDAVPADALVFSFGRGPASNVVYGAGWNAHFGSGSPSFADAEDGNPFGAALAAVLAGAHAFAREGHDASGSQSFNAYDWTATEHAARFVPAQMESLQAWLIGCGSVGSAIAYFLTFAGWRPQWTLVDGDVVKTHNLDRSPTFRDTDCGSNKAEALRNYLTRSGVRSVTAHPAYLHQIALLEQRQNGIPDLLFAAANEYDIRYRIESALPPLQLYATTGKQWQVSLIRHIPTLDACSCCLFPPVAPARPDTCATDSAVNDSGEQIDAALPFLSFAAGLMTAAEAHKLSSGREPTSPNRVTLNTFEGQFRFVHSRIPLRDGCVCADRTTEVHRAMLAGSRFAHLSDDRVEQ